MNIRRTLYIYATLAIVAIFQNFVHTIDPVYVGVLSWFMQVSDVNAMQVVGLPAWPVQLVGLAAAALGTWLVIRWRDDARQNVKRYSLAPAA